MGYRSDVVLGIAFPNTAALISFVSAQRINSKYPDVMEVLKDYVVTNADGYSSHVVLWARYADVKWNAVYNIIKINDDILACAKDAEYSTIYIEVGEEYNDTKLEVSHGDKSDGGCLYDMFGIIREVRTPNDSIALKDVKHEP